MAFNPASLDLKRLFADPEMFDSRSDFRAAGFDVFERSKEEKIMVATHKAAPEYVFKKYSKDRPLEEQLEKYEQRIEGARRVKALIDARQLQHVVVPQKALIELPKEFGSRRESSYIVIAERLELVDNDKSKRAYGHIDKDVLKDLCTVLYVFPGLDSVVDNLPFTKDGKIALIDTEHWERRQKRWEKSDRPELRHLHLSDDRMKYAKKVFKKLEEAAD